MRQRVKNICDTTIENYRYSKEKLRYDGDYINHFSSLINGCSLKQIPVNEVKDIRRYIKIKTSNMSPFRGDMLYILSFLIASNTNINIYEFIEKVIEVFDELVNKGFKECEHLVLSAYTIAKYVKDEERENIIIRMKHIFLIIKNKYGNLTKQDDYLLCSLLAVKYEQFDSITEQMEKIFNYMNELKLFSKNGIQSLTNSILLNNNQYALEKVSQLLIKLEDNDMKIGYQFLQILGVLVKEHNLGTYLEDIKEVTDYLCEQEYEYEFYLDKEFRNMIALVIAFIGNDNNKVNYIDELIAFGTYSFLYSKNQGMMNEILV